MRKQSLKLLLLCGCMTLFLSFGSCQRENIPSIFDMIDQVINIALDPGRVSINGRYHEWFPTLGSIQWVFGLGNNKDKQHLSYEKTGIIAHHGATRVYKLELLYDPSASEISCENPFQGTLIINGKKIPDSLQSFQLKEWFSEYKLLYYNHEVKLYSKTEHILILPEDLSYRKKNELKEYLKKTLKNDIVTHYFFYNKDQLAKRDWLMNGFYASNPGDNLELETYMQNTLGVNNYQILSKTPLEIIFYFCPNKGKLQRITIDIGVETKRRIEYY